MSLLAKFSTVAIAIATLAGCSVTTIAPAEQLQKNMVQGEQAKPVAKTGRDVVKKQIVTEYKCNKGKIVRVQQGSAKKNSAVTVMFNNTSHKLSAAVSDKGKKFSNIRWIWLEGLNGKATLSDNRNNVLAENCIKK